MYNSLYKDFGDTLHRIHEYEMIAMHNFVAHLQNKPYILPDVRQTSLLEGDIQKLNDITSVLNSGDFSQLLGNVEEISPLGLVYNNYLESTTNVSEKFDVLRTSLKEQMNSILESGNEEECSKFVKTVKDPSFAATLCCGKEEMDEACFTTTGFRQISADDVEKAKATLEGAKDKIKAHKDMMKANLNKKKQVLQNMDKKMEDSARKINSAKKEDCDKICDEAVVVACYLEMSDMIDHAECVALTNQILEETKQAYTMLRMLQEHNARNVKESREVTGLIQEMAMSAFEDFIQNPVMMNNTQSIQEGKVQDAFDTLKTKMAKSNEKFLKKYADAAKASKCDGIIIKKWYTPKTNIDKLYKKTMNDIKKEMDPEIKDIDELKAKYREIAGNPWLLGADGKGNKISTQMLDGKEAAMIIDLANDVEFNHKVTPSDVKEAIAFLKNSDIEIQKAEHEYQRVVMASTSGYSSMTLLRTKGEKYVKKINAYMQMIVDNVNLNYRKILLNQLKVKQQQSRAVILKAARVSSNEAVEILEKEFTIIESAFIEVENIYGGGQLLVANENYAFGGVGYDTELYAAAAKSRDNHDKFKYITKLKKSSMEAAEKELGSIPLTLKMAIIRYNGGSGNYKVKIKNKDIVFSGFLSFNKDDTESIYSLDLDYFNDKKMIPFGTTPFGDIWCYSKKTSTVVLFNHETDKITDTEKSLSVFLKELQLDK